MRVAIVVALSVVAAAVAVAAVFLFSGQGERTRREANVFLDHYLEIDIEQPTAERRERVEALARLPFADDEVASVRNGCVEAHRTLLRAEEQSAEARRLLGTALERNLEEEIPDDVRARIETSLEESSQAIADSRPLMTACEDRVRDLELRFQPLER